MSFASVSFPLVLLLSTSVRAPSSLVSVSVTVPVLCHAPPLVFVFLSHSSGARALPMLLLSFSCSCSSRVHVPRVSLRVRVPRVSLSCSRSSSVPLVFTLLPYSHTSRVSSCSCSSCVPVVLALLMCRSRDRAPHKSPRAGVFHVFLSIIENLCNFSVFLRILVNEK